ncbi:MAG TPA: hypothetical protein VFE65_34055, partial [Pseudonocardia sp.]|nr:hypothetical protein [Pseudonocardia sp.]
MSHRVLTSSEALTISTVEEIPTRVTPRSRLCLARAGLRVGLGPAADQVRRSRRQHDGVGVVEHLGLAD